MSEHESGPESPITYGLQVPRGATQLGPLVRYRSPALIAAYKPELDAAVANKEAEARVKAEEKLRQGETVPTPTVTVDTPPSNDTFKLLDDSPRPDSTISLMRVDGKPTVVVRRMLAQINAALPNSNIVLNDLSTYCTSIERRITSCRLDVRGLTKDDRDVRVVLAVDPGNYTTRTSAPSALTRPVMTLTVEYIGEPRKGQLTKESNSLDNVPDTGSPELSGLIWPKMDEDAPATSRLVNGWTAPADATIILSGFRPKFAIVTTPRAAEGDIIAQEFVRTNSPKGAFTKDIVEDLNEVSTTYTTTATGGAVARATYVLSARGNYTALFYTPAPN
ncbi:hypothetical protein [Aeromicrobium sp.]|uniref:hypothetical protein n=1 Tax=Aeromicrobium sp. TaxID=1871063 RepID=UPI0019940922|nr:hypothetical protein [Aeromicrobium sp.]MBC7630139.1 hypothetical protein [Aeromicrobium sp.]